MSSEFLKYQYFQILYSYPAVSLRELNCLIIQLVAGAWSNGKGERGGMVDLTDRAGLATYSGESGCGGSNQAVPHPQGARRVYILGDFPKPIPYLIL